jgi:hypothetical protein
MPIVRTETTLFGERFVAIFKVDKDGLFSIKLPAWSHAALGKSSVSGRTLADVERLFNLERDRYAKLRQTSSKVILYNFELQDKTGKYNGAKDERSDMGFGVGKGLQFAICNALETQHFGVSGEIERRSYKEATDQPYPLGYNYGQFGCLIARHESCQVMDWTQDRENWFLHLCRAMGGLIARIKAIDEQQSLLLSAIRDNKKLTFKA